MASRSTRRQLIPNENLCIHHKDPSAGGKTKSSKTATKKGGVGFGSRKALNDITNKTLPKEVSSKKKTLPKEDFNVAEERFLHDHEECIKAQRAAMDTFYLDMVLPVRVSTSTAEYPESKQAMDDELDSPRYYPEPELLSISTEWPSPPSSPICWDSPPSSPFAFQLEEVELVLSEENN